MVSNDGFSTDPIISHSNYLKMKHFLSSLVAMALWAPLAHAQARIATDLTNIAASANGGRVLSVTSTLDNDATYAGKNLIDGEVFDGARQSGSKGWASDKFDPINMDTVTLGFAGNEVRKIGKIVLNPTAAVTPERWAKDVEVQISSETAEGPYTAVAQLTLKRSPEPQSFNLLPVDARFVRLVFRSNWGSDRAVALGEVEIYEAIDTSDPMGQLIVNLEGAVLDLKRYRQTQIESSNAGGTVVAPVKAKKPLSAATVQMVQMVGGGDLGRFPVSRTNIALGKNGGKIVAYSSVFGNDPNYGPDKLIDGDNFRQADGQGSAGWASEGFQPGKQFVTIGFAGDRTRLVGKVVLNPVSNQPDLRWARRVDVQATSGNAIEGPYRSVATINLRSEPINQEFIFRPVEAKYLRFVFLANGPGVVLPGTDPAVNSDRAVSLGEIEVYEAVSTGDQLDTLISRFSQVLADLKTLRRSQNAAVAPAAAEVAPATLRVVPKMTKPTPVKVKRERRRAMAELAQLP